MNEQYKFRGKRIDNGEWVYGGLNCFIDKAFIQQMNWYRADGGLSVDAAQVDPKTIGQCTGIPDANREELYKDDIVRHMSIPGSGISTKELYIITWNDCGARFYLKPVRGEGGFSIFKNSDGYTPFVRVGNTHDNPDLLGVGK